MRRLVVAVAILSLALVAVPGSAAAAGVDVVAGRGYFDALGPTLIFDFMTGASDPTPGVGLDGRGMIRMQIPVLGIDDTARVLCVNVIGNQAVVITQTVHGRGTQSAGGYVVLVSDGGRTSPDTFAWFLGGPGDIGICQTPGAGVPISRGNLTLHNGA